MSFLHNLTLSAVLLLLMGPGRLPADDNQVTEPESQFMPPPIKSSYVTGISDSAKQVGAPAAPAKKEEEQDDWDDDEDEDEDEDKGSPNPLWGTPDDFSHLLHVDKEKLLCTECHKGIKTADGLKEIRPIGSKDCYPCHKKENFKKYNAEKFPTIDPSYKLPHSSLKVSLVFSHRVHANEQKFKCDDCHGKAIKEKRKINSKPTMQSCVDCHMKKADNTCMSCHDKLEKPLNHYTSMWKSPGGHGFESRLFTADCSSCHQQQNTCAECHEGLQRFNAHPAGYKYSHGMDVKFKSNDCSSCHRPIKMFCGDCHENKGR